MDKDSLDNSSRTPVFDGWTPQKPERDFLREVSSPQHRDFTIAPRHSGQNTNFGTGPQKPEQGSDFVRR